jgi:hypothetical protein
MTIFDAVHISESRSCTPAQPISQRQGTIGRHLPQIQDKLIDPTHLTLTLRQLLIRGRSLIALARIDEVNLRDAKQSFDHLKISPSLTV